ncbi:hemicentin-1 [Caerostris extrusa]|uniref:Hemicentin-1 n=1 Tax=Caerostris extrusa TaxID=172846 RepID=A0AAV4Q7H4_CAEEX|nr:hemicentin-1 [Caerostris extrusa]
MPSDMDALNGDPVSLNCKGFGTPKPTVIWSRTQGYSTLQIQPFSSHLNPLLENEPVSPVRQQLAKNDFFKWFKNGKELTKGMNTDIRSFSDLSTLVIDPLSEDDSGNYTCMANVRGLSASYTTVLEVLIPPSWSHTPNDIDALSGEAVTLNCFGSGTPKPSITWSRMQATIDKDDEGMYQCNVSNGIGSSLTKIIVVRVIEKEILIKINPFHFHLILRLVKGLVLCTPLTGEENGV